MDKDYAHTMQDDIISRADAIRWVKTECNPYGKPTLDFESGKRVMEHLEQMPSAKPKTGKWVMLERDENVHDICGVQTWGVNYMCDKCGFITTAIQDHFSQYKFCPSCGARMTPYKGGEDE